MTSFLESAAVASSVTEPMRDLAIETLKRYDKRRAVIKKHAPEWERALLLLEFAITRKVLPEPLQVLQSEL
jgi:hypothetical protein